MTKLTIAALAIVSVLGCCGLIVIGVQPPNDKAAYVVGGLAVVLLWHWKQLPLTFQVLSVLAC